MEVSKQLAAKIRQARMSSGLSQSEFGKLLGRSHAAVSDLERGKTSLSVEDLVKITNELHLPIDYLLEAVTTEFKYGNKPTDNTATIETESMIINLTG